MIEGWVIEARAGLGNAGDVVETMKNKVTEKQLVQDFDRIDEEFRARARDYVVEEFSSQIGPPSEDEVVVEPVYAYTMHAVS